MREVIRTTGYPKALGTPSIDEAAIFREVMGAQLQESVGNMAQEIISLTPDASVRGGYYTRLFNDAGRVGVAFGNNSFEWYYREYSTGPAAGNPQYFPPWSPGSRLYMWASARNLSSYIVARKIFRRGTHGNYIVSRTLPEFLPRIRADISNARRRYIRRALAMRAEDQV